METFNVSLAQGDTPVRTWRITQGGTVLNLAGTTVAAVIKTGPAVEDNAPGVHTLTEGAGLTVTDAAGGEVALDIPAEVTASPGSSYYKIRVTSGGYTETAVDGWIYVQDT